MSELTLLLAAVAEALPPADSGAGAPPRLPGHEADRLASLGATDAAPEPAARRRSPSRLRLRRPPATRPA